MIIIQQLHADLAVLVSLVGLLAGICVGFVGIGGALIHVLAWNVWHLLHVHYGWFSEIPEFQSYDVLVGIIITMQMTQAVVFSLMKKRFWIPGTSTERKVRGLVLRLGLGLVLGSPLGSLLYRRLRGDVESFRRLIAHLFFWLIWVRWAVLERWRVWRRRVGTSAADRATGAVGTSAADHSHSVDCSIDAPFENVGRGGEDQGAEEVVSRNNAARKSQIPAKKKRNGFVRLEDPPEEGEEPPSSCVLWLEKTQDRRPRQTTRRSSPTRTIIGAEMIVVPTTEEHGIDESKSDDVLRPRADTEKTLAAHPQRKTGAGDACVTGPARCCTTRVPSATHGSSSSGGVDLSDAPAQQSQRQRQQHDSGQDDRKYHHAAYVGFWLLPTGFLAGFLFGLCGVGGPVYAFLALVLPIADFPPALARILLPLASGLEVFSRCFFAGRYLDFGEYGLVYVGGRRLFGTWSVER